MEYVNVNTQTDNAGNVFQVGGKIKIKELEKCRVYGDSYFSLDSLIEKFKGKIAVIEKIFVLKNNDEIRGIQIITNLCKEYSLNPNMIEEVL